MKIAILLFACMASLDFASEMRPGLQLPPRPSVGSSSGSVENYDFPSGTTIYIRVTADTLLFGNLRSFPGIGDEIADSPYGKVYVFGHVRRTNDDTEERFKCGASLDARDDLHRSEADIGNIIRDQHSFLVYIERPGRPPFKSKLYTHYHHTANKRAVVFVGLNGTYIARGLLQRVVPNEPVWIPYEEHRSEPGRQLQPSTLQRLRAPGGSTTAEMNFQPNIHILLRGSEQAFRFENGRFCRGEDGTLEVTDPEVGDLVTQSGAPIARFRGVDQRWYPLNLRPRK